MELRIEKGDWKEMEHPAVRVRFMVFVAEQKVPKNEEIDAIDPVSTHYVARDHNGMVVACGRLSPDGHVGRLAVLKPYRGRGIGARILEAILEDAKKSGVREVVLNAPTQARGFYEKKGFKAEGGEFDECGIPHVRMRLVF